MATHTCDSCLPLPQVPHYVPWINVLRGGLNAVLAWVALLACILSYTVEWEYDHGHPVWHAEEYRRTMTVVSSALCGVPTPRCFAATCLMFCAPGMQRSLA